MNKQIALERLNQDKNYEDQLVVKLSDYFITCLEYIQDINASEKNQLNLKLNIIIEESKKHSFLFNDLIELVLNDEDDNI